MKFNSIAIKATVFEAYLTGGNITLIQGNTYENAILHHIRERTGFSPGDFEKELFPFLPQLIGEKLLKGFVGDAKLQEWEGQYHTPENWNPESGVVELPENSMVKVKILDTGSRQFVVEASLENQRRPGKNSNLTVLEGHFSTGLRGRTGYTVNFEGCSYFDRKDFDPEEMVLEFGKKEMVLYLGKKEVVKFSGYELSDLLPKGINLEEKTIRSEVQSHLDFDFRKPYPISTLSLEGIDFKLKHPIHLTKVPDRAGSVVDAMHLLVSVKNPKTTEDYQKVVQEIWNTIGSGWGFKKEDAFPNGFPSFNSYRDKLGF